MEAGSLSIKRLNLLMHRLLYLLLIPLVYFIFKEHYKNYKINLPVASATKVVKPFKTSARLKNHRSGLLCYAKQKG